MEFAVGEVWMAGSGSLHHGQLLEPDEKILHAQGRRWSLMGLDTLIRFLEAEIEIGRGLTSSGSERLSTHCDSASCCGLLLFDSGPAAERFSSAAAVPGGAMRKRRGLRKGY